VKEDKPQLRVVGPDEQDPAIVEVVPWEQMDGEPAKWFRVFRRYLEMGEGVRSIRGVWNLLREEGKIKSKSPKPSSTYYERAAEWSWESRADAWDAHEWTRRYRAWESRRQETQEAQLEQLRLARNRVAAGLAGLKLTDMKWGDAIRGFQTIMRLERELLGDNPEVRRRQTAAVAGEAGVRLDVEGLLSDVYGDQVLDSPEPDPLDTEDEVAG